MQGISSLTFYCPRCGSLKQGDHTVAPYAVSRLKANGDAFSALEVMTACSLYIYNVNRIEIAKKLYDHFAGACMEIEEIVEYLVEHGADIATALPAPTAEVYVSHALERYGWEAKERVSANLGMFP